VYSARTRTSATVNAFTERHQLLRRAGVTLVDLTGTNPTQAGLFADDSWLALLANRASAYYRPEPFGLLSARTAVAKYYEHRGLAIDPSEVVLTSSTSEAYSWIFNLLCDCGDTILFPAPSYPLLEHLAAFSQLKPAKYSIGYDGAYYIDTDSVRRQIDARTKALVLISPNNPTGSFTRQTELQDLLSLGIPIISDEVFSDYCLTPPPPDLPSALLARSSLVFALGGLSKACAWPQLKLAWIIVGGDPSLREQALSRLEIVADSYLSPNTPVQVALPELLDFGAQRHAQVQQRLLRNLQTLASASRGSAVSARPVHGGWSAVLELPLTVSGDWAMVLLEQQHVVVQPGWFYDFADDRTIIVSLLTPEDEFEAGIRRLLAVASR
jgi:alanine-synthesizing transaminase